MNPASPVSTRDDAEVNLTQLSADELTRHRDQLRGEYAVLQARDLTLDLTRGKPSAEQLDLSEALLELPGAGRHLAGDGTDARNYGGLRGLVELRRIFGELLQVPAEQLVWYPVLRTDRRPVGADAHRGRGLPDLLGQRLRRAPSDQGAPRDPGHPAAGRRGRQRRPAIRVRLHVEDHLGG